MSRSETKLLGLKERSTLLFRNRLHKTEMHINVLWDNRWEVFVHKDYEKDNQSFEADAVISYFEETDKAKACVTIKSAGAAVLVSRHCYRKEEEGEPFVIGAMLDGVDESGCCRLRFQLGYEEIYVIPEGVAQKQRGFCVCVGDKLRKNFYYEWSKNKIIVLCGKQTVMSMRPAFAYGYYRIVEINGWVLDEYLSYVPYLCAIFGLRRLY